jgi:hypothetical protein
MADELSIKISSILNQKSRKNPVINRLTGSEAMSNAIRRGGTVISLKPTK